MPSPTNGVAAKLDPYGEINRRLAELEKQVVQLRAARRLESATIGAGGLTITGAGGLNIEDALKNLLLGIGALSIPWPGGAEQDGLLAYRQNPDGTAGQLALSIFAGTGTAPQTLGLYDDKGNTLWTDDGTAQQGIARPYLSFPWAPVVASLWPSTTAGAWTNLWAAAPPKQQPKIFIAGVATTAVGVTGQLRLFDAVNNVQIGGTVTIPAGSTGTVWSIGPAAIAGNHMDTMNLELQAQVTAGTGAISAMIYSTYGQQS